MTAPEPPALACLERTRSAVLNRLIAVALGIGVSGVLLRGRDAAALRRASDLSAHGLLAGLALVAVASVVVRRLGTSRAALRDPARRALTFRRAHVRAAEIGALAVPLGLAYGWLIRPRLDAVSPFWVAALALGLLAWPRAAELDGFEDPIPEPSEPTP